MLLVIQKQKVNDIIRCKKCDIFQKLVVFFVLAYMTIMLYVGGMLMMRCCVCFCRATLVRRRGFGVVLRLTEDKQENRVPT